VTPSILVQEGLAPGRTLEEQWAVIEGAGLHGIELHGHDQAFRERLPELKAAQAAGVPMPTVCLISEVFIADFDADVRRAAIDNMKTLLSVIGELGGVGAVTPAAFGRFSKALPPFQPPRSAEEDRAVMLEALGELAEHAAAEDVHVLLEPLNRYEDHVLNKCHQAVSLIEEVGSDRIKVMADLFHMNIEEDMLPDALRATGSHLGHLHLADSGRSHPGSGHTDFAAVLETLDEIGYEGHMAMECGLRGDDKAAVLKSVADLLL
jgi:sugar phosphate isomerase/epimerase